jgi:hypothetical protein
MEQIELTFRIYRVGIEIAPYTCCKRSTDPNSKLRHYIALLENSKNNNRYTKYSCFRKSYNIQTRNHILSTSEWASIDC